MISLRFARASFVAVPLLLAACSSAPAVKTGAIQKDTTIAVLPFTNNTGDPSLDGVGTLLTDLVSAKLAPRRGFRLIERARLDQAIKEMKLGMTGVLDAATAAQVGHLLGANVVSLGSYAKLGTDAVLTTRLVRVETGEIVGGAVAHGDFDKLDKMAEKTADQIGDSIESKP